MHIKTPRLVRNRLGTYYFRIKEQGRERKFSLRTKCPITAAILALQINTEIEKGRSMNNPKLSDLNINFDSIRKYELEVGRDGGFKIRADDAADHARAMEALQAMSKVVLSPPSTINGEIVALKIQLGNSAFYVFSITRKLMRLLGIWKRQRVSLFC